MRFPRNARILRTQLDMAPFATVFFLLTLFVLLGALLPTPGLPLHLPESIDQHQSENLAGIAGPSVAVAIDAYGRLYFADRRVTEAELRVRLRQAVRQSPEPLTLVVLADKAVSYGQLHRLWMLALDTGIRDVQHAVLPRTFDAREGP